MGSGTAVAALGVSLAELRVAVVTAGVEFVTDRRGGMLGRLGLSANDGVSVSVDVTVLVCEGGFTMQCVGSVLAIWPRTFTSLPMAGGLVCVS